MDKLPQKPFCPKCKGSTFRSSGYLWEDGYYRLVCSNIKCKHIEKYSHEEYLKQSKL